MPVTVVVGGQYGSEGKGKVAHFFAKQMNASVAVRVGGPNSGHTVVTGDGKTLIFQQLPTAAVLPKTVCALAAGTYIDIDILFAEIEFSGLSPDRLVIDPNAVIITQADKDIENSNLLRQSIGSTASGTGAAVTKRIGRRSYVEMAKNHPSLLPYVQPVIPYLRKLLKKGLRVIVEGTQGFGLSILHSQEYPFVTSRDTTASGFISEVGLSPLDVDDIVLVLRAFPIRVAGNSGPIPNEINWDLLSQEVGTKGIIERTSVTKLVRRVARFDADIVRQAIDANNPTRIVINHLDYLDELSSENTLSPKVVKFLAEVAERIERSIDYIGFSPSTLAQYSETQTESKIVQMY